MKIKKPETGYPWFDDWFEANVTPLNKMIDAGLPVYKNQDDRWGVDEPRGNVKITGLVINRTRMTVYTGENE